MPKHTLQSLLSIDADDPGLEEYRRFITREMTGVRSQLFQKRAERDFWNGRALTTPGVDTTAYESQAKAGGHEVEQTLANLVAKYNSYQTQLDRLPSPLESAVTEEGEPELTDEPEPADPEPIGPVSDERRAAAG